MTKLNEIYKCEICGNIVEVVGAAGGTLVCCGKPMTLKNEATRDGAGEKHLPVVEKVDGGIKVKVGEVQHPMTPEHWINWIEVLTENEVYRAHLNPGDTPEACFCVDYDKVIAVREYCNLHGLWRNDL